MQAHTLLAVTVVLPVWRSCDMHFPCGFIIGRSRTPLTLEAFRAALAPTFPDFSATGEYFANRAFTPDEVTTLQDCLMSFGLELETHCG